MKRPWADGTEALRFDPIELMERPAVLMARIPGIAMFADLDDSEVDPALSKFFVEPMVGVLDLTAAGRRPPCWAMEMAVLAARADAQWDTSSSEQEKEMARRLGASSFLDVLASPAGIALLLDVLRREGIDPHIADSAERNHTG